ncbi:flavin-containing monooxygenase [Kibdelosporangium phytohabitans]|uniref:Flavoprotein n=1 Tax=Kibdelosporangium phytohabitans TaxID=860235 RepID=A0A0N9HYI7_9PSEU|nr:NAD(P)/FAD-dependent oxidoreductase [Kibdelosporangium phytohabitans]ALG07345.1 flavoprotein [Kibdelosporangium phytohabitans]MBE1471786.1 putative flavoprotein involved in K+ transport [Kibdelosporangium phytohabitans]
MSVEYCETVVIGAGQQGCGTAGALREIGRESIVLERGEIGQAWAYERWDSLLIGTGRRSIRFPGWSYDGDDPDGLMSGPELAHHMRRYVAEKEIRVRRHTPVRSVECLPGAGDVRFRTHLAAGGAIESRNLVAALGGYAKPRVPGLAADIDPAVAQTHSSGYRNPRSLPDGAVLVVGTGISGQQIADELVDAGRKVYLSVGRHRVYPRRYRGRGIHEWMYIFSLYEDFVTHETAGGDRRALFGLPVMATRDGCDDLNLGTLAAKGVVLVGTARGAQGNVLTLEDNVVAVAEESAQSARRVTDKIDAGLRRRGFVATEPERVPVVDLSNVSDFGERLDLAAHGVTSIVWCTGFGPDYRILPERVLDERGAPIQQKGILGAVPGLYYAGLPDGNSLAPGAISANVTNGRFIARHIHIDHMMRTGCAGSITPPEPASW